MNDRDYLYVLLVVISTFLVAFSTGHSVGFEAGEAQSDETAYVTCSTINGTSTMCFTSGDVEFEWMDEANTTTRNGTMNLRMINQTHAE